jgi:GntR family transcriptional regulator / MocR family aminotransferase
MVGLPTTVAASSRSRILAEQLRQQILNGTLVAGTTVPSSRSLAVELGIARGTVVVVFEQLIAEGYLEAQRGSGTRVAARVSQAATEASVERAAIPIERIAGHNPGQPDPRLFPRRAWQRSLDQALSTIPDGDLRYGDSRGDIGLREALCTYLARSRGISTDADRIVIINGVAQALAITAIHLKRTLSTPTIAVEDPGSTGAAGQLSWWNVTVCRVPVDHEGITTSELYRSSAHAVVVTPAHQYPTGVALSGDRRISLLRWAAERDALIIEDDYDAEYRYDRDPLSSLHTQSPRHVVAVGSVSKSLSPSLRLGWMVVPDHLVAPFAAIKANIDIGTSIIPQVALAHFINSGSMDRHLRVTRTEYRKRRNAILEGLHATAPACRIGGVAAGLHLVVTVGSHSHLAEAVEFARSVGFDAQPLGRYATQTHEPSIVLGYGPLNIAAASKAARALGTLITDMSAG